MKKFVLASLASLTLLSACSEKKPEYAQVLSQQWIEPVHRQLAETTDSYHQQAVTACADKQLDDKELIQIRQGWLTSMQQWQRAQAIHFGPAEQHNLRWRYQFWPDLHNNTRRKVQALLKSEETLDSEHLVKAGVVVRGFSALEYLLFDADNVDAYSGASKMVERNCEYLVLATEDLARTSAELLAGWQQGAEYRQQFDHPGENNPVFPQHSDVQAAMLDAIVSQLEIIKNDKLAGPLGLKTDKARPNSYLAEAWRSQQSLAMLAVNQQAIEALLLNHSYGLVGQIEQTRIREKLTAQITEQLQLISTAASALGDTTLTTALKTDMAKLQALHDAWAALLITVKQQLPQALGVTLGFNGNDGD